MEGISGLGFFDPFRPDETIYSGCARFNDHTQYSGHRTINTELFGQPNIVAVMDLPSHLGAFVSRQPIGHGYTVEYLIDNHTLLPYYSMFLPESRIEQLRQDMAGESGTVIHSRVGAMAGRIPLPACAQYCSICFQQDIAEYGEPYWHRVHQLPGIHTCPRHAVWLESAVPLRLRGQRHEFVSARTISPVSQPRFLVLQEPQHRIQLELAQSAMWLLEKQQRQLNLDEISRRYRQLLTNLGFLTFSDRIRIKELITAVEAHFTQGTLRSLHCQLDDASDNWLLRLIRNPQKTQMPIQHLLLMHFVGKSAEEFCEYSPDEYLPFGRGPWPCLNRVCPRHEKLVISQCSVEYKNGQVLGSFQCVCGFEYSRGGPDTNFQDRYRIGRIVKFGQVWLSTLATLNEDPSLSLREKARRLGVDPRTVIRQTESLHKACLTETTINYPALMCQQRRSSWLRLQQIHPLLSVTELRRLDSATYSWLYRNDREWLLGHQPTKVGSVEPQSDLTRVNWSNRDAELAKKVPLAALEIRCVRTKPIPQITKSAVARRLGISSLIFRHTDKLPKTLAALEAEEEDQTRFGLRRIDIAISEFQKQGILPKRWQLIKSAGVERIKDVPEIQSAIEAALEVLTSFQSKPIIV